MGTTLLTFHHLIMDFSKSELKVRPLDQSHFEHSGGESCPEVDVATANADMRFVVDVTPLAEISPFTHAGCGCNSMEMSTGIVTTGAAYAHLNHVHVYCSLLDRHQDAAAHDGDSGAVAMKVTVSYAGLVAL